MGVRISSCVSSSFKEDTSPIGSKLHPVTLFNLNYPQIPSFWGLGPQHMNLRNSLGDSSNYGVRGNRAHVAAQH